MSMDASKVATRLRCKYDNRSNSLFTSVYSTSRKNIKRIAGLDRLGSEYFKEIKEHLYELGLNIKRAAKGKYLISEFATDLYIQ